MNPQENEVHPSTDTQGGSAKLAVIRPFARFEDQYLMIPNVIIDYLIPYCTPTAFVVLMVIYRKTFGWRKREDRISYSQIEQATGLSHNAVYHALRFLEGKPDKRKPNSKTPEYQLINIRREPRKNSVGDDCYYSLNQTFELPVMLTGEGDDEYWVDGLTVFGNQYFKSTDTSTLNEPAPVLLKDTQKTEINKDTGRIGIDDYIEGMLTEYNSTFNKRARRSKAVEKAAAELMLKGVPLTDYAEGCRQYQKHGTRNIRGPESIAPWAEGVKHDREQGVSITKGGGYWDANMNWIEE